VESISDRYEEYRHACEATGYRLHAAIAPTEQPRLERRSLATLDAEFEDLTSGDALEALRRERDAARSDREQLRTSRLVFACEQTYIDAALREGADALARSHANGASGESTSSVREELFLAHGQACRELGYASGLARTRARLPGVSIEGWVGAAERYLSATDVLYRAEVEHVFPRLGIDPKRATLRDLPRLDHLGGEFDELFPAGRAIDALVPLLAAFGIDPRHLRGLRIDREPREGRVPGVARFLLSAPGDVVVSAGAQAGPGAYAALFHAVGRALPAAFTSDSLPHELRRPFDRALERGFGWLLSDRLADPAWFESLAAGRHAEALLRAFRLRHFFALRRACARLLFGWELAERAPGAALRRHADAYAEGARRATGLECPPPSFLDGQDPELSALDELRGRSFSAALAAHLRDKFGWRFWRERRAGELLKELWNTGTSYTVEQVALELGLGGLDVEPWIDSAARGI